MSGTRPKSGDVSKPHRPQNETRRHAFDISIQLISKYHLVFIYREGNRQSILLPRHVRAPDPKVKKYRSAEHCRQYEAYIGGIRDHGLTHIASLIFQPSVWPEGIGIVSKNFGVLMNNPRIHTNNCLATVSLHRLPERPSLTPSGIYLPSTAIPPTGVTRGRLIPTAG